MINQLIEKRKAWLKEIETQDNRATAKPIIIALQLRREYPAAEGYGQDGYWVDDGDGNVLKEPIPYKVHWEDEQHFFTYSALQDHLRRNRHNYPENRDYVKYAYRNSEWEDIPGDFRTMIEEIERLQAELDKKVKV